MAKHLFISGRVQGVSFRAFAAKLAARYGVSGWVRNLSDGRVEALLSDLPAEMEAELRRGPRFGHVERIEMSDAESAPEGFEIRRTV